jgi:hypothetical protein
MFCQVVLERCSCFTGGPVPCLCLIDIACTPAAIGIKLSSLLMLCAGAVQPGMAASWLSAAVCTNY